MRKTSSKNTVLGITAVLLLIILAHYIGLLSPIEKALGRLLYPTTSAVYSWSATIDGNTVSFTSVEKLQEAYTDLRVEVSKRQVHEAELWDLRRENEELRKQLNFFEREQYTSIGADVIGENIDPIANELLINRGTDDGIALGQPVIIGEGIIVGKIASVTEKSANIRLINDNQSSIAATVQGEDISSGLVQGGYGISIRMNFIPQNESIEIEDTIVTSGLEQGIPKGLLIGYIESIEKEPYQPFQRAVVRPAELLDKIKHVSVLVAIE